MDKVDNETRVELKTPKQIIEARGGIVIEPKKYVLPKKYAIHGNEPHQREDMQTAIDAFTNFLEKPLIIGPFSNNAQRSQWRKDTYEEIEKQEGEIAAKRFDTYFKSNKLTQNSIFAILGNLEVLRNVGLRNELVNELNNNIEPLLRIETIAPIREKIRTYIATHRINDPVEIRNMEQFIIRENGGEAFPIIYPTDKMTQNEIIARIDEISGTVAKILNSLAKKT